MADFSTETVILKCFEEKKATRRKKSIFPEIFSEPCKKTPSQMFDKTKFLIHLCIISNCFCIKFYKRLNNSVKMLVKALTTHGRMNMKQIWYYFSKIFTSTSSISHKFREAILFKNLNVCIGSVKKNNVVHLGCEKNRKTFNVVYIGSMKSVVYYGLATWCKLALTVKQIQFDIEVMY